MSSLWVVHIVSLTDAGLDFRGIASQIAHVLLHNSYQSTGELFYLLSFLHGIHSTGMSQEPCATLDRQKMLRRAQLEVSVLSSNEILSNIEQQDLRELLSEAETEVESLNSDICRLQVAQERLIERRAREIDRIERLRAGFAPHKKLVPEVLSQIFGWCMNGHLNSLARRDRYGLQAWNLSRVCTGWRRIALTEPSLWNRIDVPECYAVFPTIVHSLVDIFTNRGGNGVIHFFVSLGCEEDWMMTQRLISEYPSRLQVLQLNIKTFPESPLRLTNMFNHLTSLTLRANSLEYIILGHTPFMDISKAHGLRSLTIHCNPRLAILFMPPRISAPWMQLTSLAMSKIPACDFATIFSQCTNLVHCSVSFIDSTRPITQNHIRSKYLQTLEFGSGQGINPFIAVLITPALKSITFDWINTWLQDEFLLFVDRSSCTIQKFCVRPPVISECDFVPLLRAMPALTEISAYTSQPISQETLSTIVAEGLAQGLRTIGIKVASLPSAVDFLWGRWNSSACKGVYKAKILLRGPLPQDDISYCKSVLSNFHNHGENIELMGTDDPAGRSMKPLFQFMT